MSDNDKKQTENFKKIAEIPFDPVRKRNSVLVKDKNDYLLIIRGAPEEIFKLSNFPDQQAQVNAKVWVQNKGKEGKRVLAIAVKKIKTVKSDLVSEEKNLKFIGCISFYDPIKPTASAAIKKAEDLGVGIKILTGDSKEVATMVAYEVDLIKDKNKVITGDEFIYQTQEKQHRLVKEYQVFARVTPEQKYKIIQLLQEKYEVGFLGEGINDAPAPDLGHLVSQSL